MDTGTSNDIVLECGKVYNFTWIAHDSSEMFKDEFIKNGKWSIDLTKCFDVQVYLDEYLKFGYEKDAKGSKDWIKDKNGDWKYIGKREDKRSEYYLDEEWHEKEK